MYNFKSDYLEGAHPNIIEALTKTNLEQTNGYSNDEYTKKAHELIKKAIGNELVDIHLLVGGTQTNLIAISSFLRPHHAVIAVESSHIAVHETGAIEACGHKIITVKGEQGKITPQDILTVLSDHTDEHMVLPKLVFISNATELGTIYTYEELVALRKVTEANNLLLYIDGARLSNALVSDKNNLPLTAYPNLCDAFYIGGTKNGALFGEALVIVKEELKPEFRFFIKQKGAMLAKGRLLAIQFIELFSDDLYFDLGRHANMMAQKLANGLHESGVEFSAPFVTNQIFVVLFDEELAKISEKFEYTYMKSVNEKQSEIRLVTSWATPAAEVDSFISLVKELRGN